MPLTVVKIVARVVANVVVVFGVRKASESGNVSLVAFDNCSIKASFEGVFGDVT